MKKEESILVLFLSTMENMEAGSGFGRLALACGAVNSCIRMPLLKQSVHRQSLLE